MIKRYKSSKHFLKIVSLFLLVSMFAGLISCKTPDVPTDKNESDTLTKNFGSTESVTSIDDIYPYPEHNFGGAVIKVLARNDGYGGQDYEDILVEEMNGEVLNDAVYKRTATVEEKYNVKLEITYDKDPSILTSKNVMAGEDAYQFLQEKLIKLQPLAVQNNLIDFNIIAAITLEAPWYNQNMIKDLAINKKVTALGGDMTVSDKSGVMVTVFNKKMVVENGMEDMYQIVRGGKWTLDKLHELIKITSKDLNGDGKMTLKDDRWGFMAENLVDWTLLTGSGNRLAALDENGIPYITAKTPKFLSDLDRILDIMYDKKSRVKSELIEDYYNVFMDNRNFLQINAMSTIFMMRGMENDFGIIPIPKLDEQQPDYITTMSPFVSRFIAVPSTCQEVEMTGAVIDAMARESANTVMPAYYGNLLNNKIARDEESVEMLKIIFDSVIYDIGAVYNWGNLWLMHQQFIDSGSRDYVSFFEKHEPEIQKALDDTINEMLNHN